MLTFFRRFTKSKFGLPLALAFVLLMGLAFAASDVTNTGFSFGGAGTGAGEVARIGDRPVTEREVERRTKLVLSNEQQRNPQLDAAAFYAGEGFEGVLDGLLDFRALEELGEESGMVAGRALVDGEIASERRYFGPTGRFDENLFREVHKAQGQTVDDARRDFASDILVNHVVTPALREPRMPLAIARRYAALALETRRGQSGFIRAGSLVASTVPGDQEITAYYTRQIARYTIPERRVIRYAPFGIAQLGAAAQPSEADVSDWYRRNAARYAAGETRTLTQVILPDQNAANALAGRVRGGTSFADAARAVGREPATLQPQTKAAYGGLASAAVANAAFAAPEGQIAAPARSQLGWHVVRVDRINRTPARTLDQVRAEITPIVAREKGFALLSELSAKIEDARADGATFDEIVRDNRLQVQTSPAVTSQGVDPSNPASRPDAALTRFLAPMFEADPDDDPSIEEIAPNEQYVLSDLERVIPAAPRPLAQIRQQVTADLIRDKAFARAGDIAREIAAKASRGVPLAQAFREAGQPAPSAIGGARRALGQQGQLGPDVRRLFDMAPRTAKRVEAPDRSGWYVVALDSIETGDPDADPRLVPAAQSELGQLLGAEYAQQLAVAARQTYGVRRDAEAQARLKARLAGTGGR